MKHRLSYQNSLPSLFNLDLHRQKNKILLSQENYSYKRKAETLENPGRKSLRLAEFVTFFWTLLSTEANIAVLNTAEVRAFSYEHWFEGTNIQCYEGGWVPGLWSNPLLGNQIPDLVILLSINPENRFTILRELDNLHLPVINFSSETVHWNHFITPPNDDYKITHFYMEIIRFLALRSQQLNDNSTLYSKDVDGEENFSDQIHRIVNSARKQKASRKPKLVWTRLKKLKRKHLEKKLISSKRKKGYIRGQLKIVPLLLPTIFHKKVSYSKKKRKGRRRA